MASKDAGAADPEREVADLPPSGTSLHKRRRGEPPESLKVKSPSPSDMEGSPLTSTATPYDLWSSNEPHDPLDFCNNMLERLKHKDDILSQQGIDLAFKTKNTLEALDQLEKLLDVLEEVVNLKDKNARILKRLKDVEQMKKLQEARLKISIENERLKDEKKELEMLSEAFEGDLDLEYGLSIYDGLLSGGRLLKRGGSKWKSQRFRGSLLRKQRSRSAGGEEEATPTTPLRRMSEVFTCKDMEKSKVSKWTKVKAAFRWEKAQWPPVVGGTSGAVAAGALVGAVVLAGTSPPLEPPDPPREASLTPGSALSLTPNSSCEELRLDSGSSRRNHRCEDIDNTFLHAPTQEDSSSPSPNKLHKSPWDKMRDIIHTRRESVRKKSRARGSPEGPRRRSPEGPRRRSPEGPRRRSLSDGGDSDAPPVLTLTIPSSEELESDPTLPVLRKQRSLELAARLPRPARASKWSKVKRAFLTSHSASVPCSPSRHSAFFTDAETEGVSSGCEAAAVRDEIARDYAALQSRLRREFLDRQGKLHSASRPVATEEQLSADFRKKLAEWQLMKGGRGGRQPPPVPARKDLSEDFLKKWDDWKHMKETNSVPAWEQAARPDEVLVQTSTGLFKFKGISRSFTRKLHEWEKSRGIAPEASTSALLRAARERSAKPPAAPLTRAQSDGSVAPSASGSGRRRASSLSVNDADHLDADYADRDSLDGGGGCPRSRGAVLVEVEAEEVCTAAPLVARSPRPAPQTPVYTYGAAEPRLLCETAAAVAGTAVRGTTGAGARATKGLNGKKVKKGPEQKTIQKSKRKVFRQPSLEEDAKFIRDTIEQIERGSSTRLKENAEMDEEKVDYTTNDSNDYPSTEIKNKIGETNINFLSIDEANLSESSKTHDLEDQLILDDKKRDIDKTNGKKKTKSRARLEREHSKPSESDTGEDVDTVTVEIPRRRKRPRRQSEKPRTPPTSLHSDSEGEIFVLKLKAPEPREGSPEVIVRTTRKIFSPVVRCGESVPRAVISVNVDDLAEVKAPSEAGHKGPTRKEMLNSRSKSSGDLGSGDGEETRTRARPPLPLSPLSQRKPQSKETAPSIRIMIQRYNLKINEDGHTSGPSSGASSPAWRSPAAERRRPPDMPVGLNIRNNPFLEKEVQKSASASQLPRRAQTPTAQPPLPLSAPDGVLKSRSANAFLHDKVSLQQHTEDSKETIAATSTDTITPDLTRNLPIFSSLAKADTQSVPNVLKVSGTPRPALFERSVSTVESREAGVTERARRIREARERFLATVPMRREGTNSASDLRPGDRSSRISTSSDVPPAPAPRAPLPRSASTGMVNVQQSAWDRLTDGSRGGRSKSKFSLSRLAAKLRRRDDGAVSRLCRQSLLVQLRTKPT